MTNLVKHIFVFAISVHMTFATKIGCGGNAYDTSNWDNDAFRYYFLPSNIEKTLYCIGFDKNRLTKNDESTTTLNAAGGSIHRSLISFEHLDEETNLLYFRETFYLVLYNEQLHINRSLDNFKLCKSVKFDIPTKYATSFLPNQIGKDYWTDHKFSRLQICPAGTIHVISSSQDITKQWCEIELYSYPFDKHTCEVSFAFGKFSLGLSDSLDALQLSFK